MCLYLTSTLFIFFMAASTPVGAPVSGPETPAEPAGTAETAPNTPVVPRSVSSALMPKSKTAATKTATVPPELQDAPCFQAPVQSLFLRLDSEHVQCLLCRAKLATSNGIGQAMQRHLDSVEHTKMHPSFAYIAQRAVAPPSTQGTLRATPGAVDPKHLTNEKLLGLFVHLATSTNTPLSMVDNPQFRKFVNGVAGVTPETTAAVIFLSDCNVYH
jgi:hypothetical protein